MSNPENRNFINYDNTNISATTAGQDNDNNKTQLLATTMTTNNALTDSVRSLTDTQPSVSLQAAASASAATALPSSGDLNQIMDILKFFTSNPNANAIPILQQAIPASISSNPSPITSSNAPAATLIASTSVVDPRTQPMAPAGLMPSVMTNVLPNNAAPPTRVVYVPVAVDANAPPVAIPDIILNSFGQQQQAPPPASLQQQQYPPFQYQQQQQPPPQQYQQQQYPPYQYQQQQQQPPMDYNNSNNYNNDNYNNNNYSGQQPPFQQPLRGNYYQQGDFNNRNSSNNNNNNNNNRNQRNQQPPSRRPRDRSPPSYRRDSNPQRSNSNNRRDSSPERFERERGGNSKDGGEDKTRICSFFDSAVGCRNGDRCPFSHVRGGDSEHRLRPDDYQPPGKKLFIKNVENVTREELEETFQKFGPMEEVRIFHERNYAFINYDNEEDARTARFAMDGQRVGQSIVSVRFGKVQH